LKRVEEDGNRWERLKMSGVDCRWVMVLENEYRCSWVCSGALPRGDKRVEWVESGRKLRRYHFRWAKALWILANSIPWRRIKRSETLVSGRERRV
jgi:hypothetical protein